MTTRRARGPRAIALALLVIVAIAGLAEARPGGGESYSGGGGHGGGGGGGGGGGAGLLELVYWLLRLAIAVPQVGVPLIACVIGYFIYSAYKQAKNRDWDSGPPVALERAVTLDPVRALDPDFSQSVFEDFVYRLFSTAHRARHAEATLAAIAPYVGPGARHALHTRPPAFVPVRSVVVGALRITRVDVPSNLAADTADDRVRIRVELEANVTTEPQTSYSVESWLFVRDASRRTRPPSATRGFPCPNCGAPWQAADTGSQVCASCGEAVDNGRFDWTVESIALRSIDERPPTLTEEVPERGTDLPTYHQPDLYDRLTALEHRDPAATGNAILARLYMIYDQLNRAWTANDLAPVRGLLSDGLYDYMQYWTQAYRDQGLRNELVDMRITDARFAKLTHDRWYDAITVRLWATGKDYVVRIADGSLVRGSKHRERPYSEYWTLIRSSARQGPAGTTPTCPSCGAPLKIGMAGACEYCGAHVTAGEFDWVLSKIEQDDSYRG